MIFSTKCDQENLILNSCHNEQFKTSQWLLNFICSSSYTYLVFISKYEKNITIFLIPVMKKKFSWFGMEYCYPTHCVLSIALDKLICLQKSWELMYKKLITFWPWTRMTQLHWLKRITWSWDWCRFLHRRQYADRVINFIAFLITVLVLYKAVLFIRFVTV